MSNALTNVTTDDLQAFADAWNRHDVDALMSFMTEDCVFEASAGLEICGERFEGHEAVRGRTERRSRCTGVTCSRFAMARFP